LWLLTLRRCRPLANLLTFKLVLGAASIGPIPWYFWWWKVENNLRMRLLGEKK
jgi:hypothetical protein